MAGSNWSRANVAVVTGGNRGIGLEIVRQLAEAGLTVVLTARDEERGRTAVEGLRAQGLTAVEFHALDVGSAESIAALAAWLGRKFPGLDVLVNNAGYQSMVFGYDQARAVVDTNYRAVKAVTEGLLPLLRAGARVVNVSSQRAAYERLPSEALKRRFRDEEGYGEDMLESLAEKYLDDVKAGRSDAEGWIPSAGEQGPMYSESKMFLNVYAAILAKKLARSQPESHRIFVASFCPGVVETDMYKAAIAAGRKPPVAFKANTVAEGADTGVWLALLPAEEMAEKSGKLFYDRKEYAFGANPLG